jgi:hypothetical protein
MYTQLHHLLKKTNGIFISIDSTNLYIIAVEDGFHAIMRNLGGNLAKQMNASSFLQKYYDGNLSFMMPTFFLGYLCFSATNSLVPFDVDSQLELLYGMSLIRIYYRRIIGK